MRRPVGARAGMQIGNHRDIAGFGKLIGQLLNSVRKTQSGRPRARLGGSNDSRKK